MLLTLTFLVVGLLHTAPGTVVTNFHEPVIQGTQLNEQSIPGIVLQASNLTIVKTWAPQ